VPAGLDAVLSKALMKPPAERHADAREFALALRNLQDEQESDVRARLAQTLKEDFGPEMAEKLNLESLAHRDEAWRRLSTAPSRRETGVRRGERAAATTGELRSATGAEPALPAAPAAMGATVAHSPTARASRQIPGYSSTRPPAPNNDVTVTATATGSLGEARAKAVPDPTMRQRKPPSTPATGIEQASAAATPTLEDIPAPRPASATSRSLLLGLCVVGGLAVTALVLQFTQPSAPPVAPSIRVVSLPSESAPVATPGPQPIAAPEVTTPPIAAPEPAKPVKTRRNNSPDAQSLTQALRRQQGKLEGCFREHSVTLEGQPVTQLEFDIEASGKLTRVALVPRALAATALGDCLLAVGRSTTFPAQPHAVSFAIPLTARRAH
jgi:hypothetical protein